MSVVYRAPRTPRLPLRHRRTPLLLERIYYEGRFFSYPLKAAEAPVKLGVIEAARCVLSYLRAKAFPIRAPRSFEDWVTNQFGHRLFRMFFKTYTEKVWRRILCLGLAAGTHYTRRLCRASRREIALHAPQCARVSW